MCWWAEPMSTRIGILADQQLSRSDYTLEPILLCYIFTTMIRAGTLESKKGEDGPSKSKNAPKREKNPRATSTRLAPHPPQPHEKCSFRQRKAPSGLAKGYARTLRVCEKQKDRS